MIRKEFPCYDDRRGGFRRAQLKTGRSFDEKDLAVLASLYQQVVVEDLLAGYDRHHIIHEIVITLASQDERKVLPTDSFVASISTDSLTALPPDTSTVDYYECELRLWAWISADSASVEATLKHSSSRIVRYIIGRGGLVVSDGERWTVCPWRFWAF